MCEPRGRRPLSSAEVYAFAALAIPGPTVTMWTVGLLMRHSSIVGIFWDSGFALTNAVYCASTSASVPRFARGRDHKDG